MTRSFCLPSALLLLSIWTRLVVGNVQSLSVKRKVQDITLDCSPGSYCYKSSVTIHVYPLDASLFRFGRSQYLLSDGIFFFWDRLQVAWQVAATEAWAGVVQGPAIVEELEQAKWRGAGNDLCYAFDGPDGVPGLVQNYDFFLEYTVTADSSSISVSRNALEPPLIDFDQILVKVINSNQDELVNRIRESAKIQDSRFSLRLQHIDGVIAMNMTEAEVAEYIDNEDEKSCGLDTCTYESDDSSGCAHEGIAISNADDNASNEQGDLAATENSNVEEHDLEDAESPSKFNAQSGSDALTFHLGQCLFAMVTLTPLLVL